MAGMMVSKRSLFVGVVLILFLAAFVSGCTSLTNQIGSTTPSTTAKYGLSINTTFVPNTSVVNVIEVNANLTTLALLIQEANLTETLSNGGPYTVFAPDNMAFADLGNDTISDLAENTSELARILTYHVVPGEYSAEELLNMTAGGNETMLENLAGENLTLCQAENGSLTVNGALVVTPNLGADNGIVHVINAVLASPATNETPTPTTSPPTTVVATVPTTAKPIYTSTPAIGTSGGVCDCSGNIYNCDDFSTQREAQECFDYCLSRGLGDIHKLDADNDGIACENLD